MPDKIIRRAVKAVHALHKFILAPGLAAATGLAAAVFLSSLSSVTAEAESYEQQLANQRAMPIESNDVPDWPKGPEVTAEAAILMEASTGTVLYAKNIHKQEYPASCTKILTCLIAAERCEMDEMVYLSHDAVFDTPRDSNHIALDEGEEITMEEALNAMLIRSANEVSFAVGEHISGTSWQDFAAIMNERARQLGCLNSNFVNPNGLPDENHYTTAYDLATIARAFFANEMLAALSRATKLELMPTDKQPDHILEYTKNQLLPGQSRAYPYLVGSKTGYTDAARNCLVSCAEKDGLRLICVVLRDASPAHYEDTLALFDYGFNNFKKVNVSQSETRYHIDNAGFFDSEDNTFGSFEPLLVLNTEDFLVLPINAAFGDTVSEISYDTGDEGRAALISYTWNGVPVATASLDFSPKAVHASPFAAKPDGQDTQQTESPQSDVTRPDGHRAHRPASLILKILLATAVILTLALLFLGVLYVRRNPGLFGRRRARRGSYKNRRRPRRRGRNPRRPPFRRGY